jgi:hypothetical protein
MDLRIRSATRSAQKVRQGRSDGIVENDPQGVAMARAQLADAVTHVDAVGAARAPHRPAVDREYDGVAFPQRRHRDARLHARALFGQDEFPTREVFARLAKQCRDLQWKTCSP